MPHEVTSQSCWRCWTPRPASAAASALRAILDVPSIGSAEAPQESPGAEAVAVTLGGDDARVVASVRAADREAAEASGSASAAMSASRAVRDLGPGPAY